MVSTNDWAGCWQVQNDVNDNLTPEAALGNTFTTAVAGPTGGPFTLTFTTTSTGSVWNGQSFSLPANVASITGSITDTVGKTDHHSFTLTLTVNRDPRGGLVNKQLDCSLDGGRAALPRRGSTHDDSGGSWTAQAPPPPPTPAPPPGYRHRHHRRPRYSKPQEPQAEA